MTRPDMILAATITPEFDGKPLGFRIKLAVLRSSNLTDFLARYRAARGPINPALRTRLQDAYNAIRRAQREAEKRSELLTPVHYRPAGQQELPAEELSRADARRQAWLNSLPRRGANAA